MVRALETNATGSQADIPSEYVVENYGTTASIETNNPIGSEDLANNELGVALWLAGYEQGRMGDLHLTPSGSASTHLSVTRQSSTPLGGFDTGVALSAAEMQASSYTISLNNSSGNSSNWYIPTLKAMQSGQSEDWRVHLLLNGVDITSDLLSHAGFTFNATAAHTDAGLVMNPGTSQLLTITFEPLTLNAANEPYSFELKGLAHPGASDAFASITFAVVPEPSMVGMVGWMMLLGFGRPISRCRDSWFERSR